MSVQVRRRREAASFLSSFVGALGELLVDTTNNRVQVHDGATPGGWPAAGIGDLTGRNAIVNGNFCINQRGSASGASLSAGTYAHDRWKAGASGCTYAFTQSLPDTTVTITAGSLLQVIDVPNVWSSALWLSWLGTAQARAYQGTAAGAYAPGTPRAVGGVTVNTLLLTGLTLGATLTVEFAPGAGAGGTLGLVQVEPALPNAGSTRFDRHQYAVEAVICQRYYFRLVAANNDLFTIVPRQAANIEPYRVGYFPFPAVMRATPTLTIQALDEASGKLIACNPVNPTPNGTGLFATASTNSGIVDIASIIANAEL